MPAKLIIYNSHSHAGTLGSALYSSQRRVSTVYGKEMSAFYSITREKDSLLCRVRST